MIQSISITMHTFILIRKYNLKESYDASAKTMINALVSTWVWVYF